MIHRIRYWPGLALLFAICQWLAPTAFTPLGTAQASVPGVTCSANITSATFGNADPSALGLGNFSLNGNSNLQTTGFLTYYCTNTTATTQNIAICVGIGNPGGATQRTMNGPKKGTLIYQLYQDAGNSITWGSKSQPTWGSPYAATVAVPASGTSAPVTVPIYATIASSQVNWNTNTTGPYSALYGGGDVTFDTGPVGSGCTGASGGGSITGFTVSANMQATCQVTTNPLTFLTPANGDPSAVTASTQLTVNCTDGDIGYQVGLDNGKNWNGTSRRMRGGPTHSDYISYGLYQDSGNTITWGNTYNSDTQVGTTSTQLFTVYGQVNAGQGMPAAGNYFDAVTVYVYY